VAAWSGEGEAARERADRSPAGAAVPPAALEPLRAALGARRLAGAIVLGSGLGPLLEAWAPLLVASGKELPGYPRSGVAGHAGRVAVVPWGSAAGLVLQGRVHFYEGFARGEVTFGVRLAAALGARWMLFTNAAGSLDPRVVPGTVAVIDDHLRLFLGAGPARGAESPLRLRGSPYHARRAEQAFAALSREGLRAVRGILGGFLGPSYETAAEVEMLRRAGATVACMSTVIEAEEAAILGLEVAALSLVTNLGTGLSGGALAHEEVVAAAALAGPRLARAIAALAETWAGEAG